MPDDERTRDPNSATDAGPRHIGDVARDVVDNVVIAAAWIDMQRAQPARSVTDTVTDIVQCSVGKAR